MSVSPKQLRALLILGRVSNLPTVWSNCFAGWWLAGSGSWPGFAQLCLAASCLYLGGMYLNDAFDAQFDSQHRPERPIPSGIISAATVWKLGFGWLALGFALVAPFGMTAFACAALLVLAILIYDAIHKLVAFAPVLMAACRFFLMLLAAATARDGITGHSLWVALVLAAYIVGLSYIARRESALGPLRYWPMLFLIAPVILALIVNQGEPFLPAVLLCLAAVVWMFRCLRYVIGSTQRNIGRCVSGLLAGIPLMDLLAVWDGSPVTVITFIALFGLSLLLQRFVPAT